jgi:preprotein translocase subunit SecD
MIKSIKLRLLIVLVTVVLAVLYLVPTLTNNLPSWWGKILPTEQIHLGLDLQGGIHLLMEVDVAKAMEATTDRIGGEIQSLLHEKKMDFVAVKQVEAGELSIKMADGVDMTEVRSMFDKELPQWKLMFAKGQSLNYKVEAAERKRIEKMAVEQAVETMRNRIDQFGVSEPEIRPQANNRILVQLPGIKDTKRAIELIGKTALLEFKLVSNKINPQDLGSGNLPDDIEILYQQEYDPVTRKIIRQVPYALEKKTLMTGEYIADAKVRFNSSYGEPYVAMDFNSRGGKLFDRITAENVKRRLAIILDNHVYSAPVIQERISGGKAQISGRFDAKEARDLAIVLRAGALPAPIRILEKRTVGPSLGHDSISKGLISMVIGFVLVVIFMVLYYHLSGLIANLALVLNLLFIVSILALAKATLTLPGIAGIVLTIGMAVDANVLIFERIKEELRLGKTTRAALDSGYSKAFLTIMDANITTLIAAIVLYQYGTGPIKGFAVTLSIGIVCSLYTAIFVTRLVYDSILEKKSLKQLSI